MSEERNKMSPPPAARPTEGERYLLAGFVHSSGYPLVLDELHRFAIEQEVEVFVGDIADRRATLERVYMARAAWLVLDRIQQRVKRAIEEERELQDRRRVENSYQGSASTEEVLGFE